MITLPKDETKVPMIHNVPKEKCTSLLPTSYNALTQWSKISGQHLCSLQIDHGQQISYTIAWN